MKALFSSGRGIGEPTEEPEKHGVRKVMKGRDGHKWRVSHRRVMHYNYKFWKRVD